MTSTTARKPFSETADEVQGQGIRQTSPGIRQFPIQNLHGGRLRLRHSPMDIPFRVLLEWQAQTMISRLQPNRVRRSYLGGSRIDAFCGTGGAPRQQAYNSKEPPRPEDWLASTTQAFNGTLEIEDEGLGRLEDGRLVREAVGALPILVKLLDSDERLVMQAHPTVPCAERLFHSPVGKTECWYFLPGTAPSACVYLGFRPGITREAWEAAVHAQAPLLDMLHRIPVVPGDFVFVEGGVPHAIGGGCFMVELQEPSDLMVVAERFTPSGRRIPDAKMHGGVGWDRMFDVYEYDGRTYEETVATYVRRGGGALGDRALPVGADRRATRICGPEFTDKFEMWRLSGGGSVALSGASAVAVVTDGTGLINGPPVQCGDRLVISGEASIRAEGALSTVVCFRRTAQTAAATKALS